MQYNECPDCGVYHGFPDALHNKAKQGKPEVSICCPNGHSWHYTGETEEDKLRRERDRLKQCAAQKDDYINDLEKRSVKERARTAAQKGHNTRLKKRAKAGVCPCCNRTFSQLAAHMKTKHPDFVKVKS